MKALPDFIGQFVALKLLRVENCPKFSYVHRPLGRCKELQYLEVINCQSFVALTNSINECKALKALDFTDCPQLKVIPQDIAKRMGTKLKIFTRGSGLDQGMI